MTQVATPAESISITIDGAQIDVPKGTLAIRAAEQIGISIPRFCDHPLLEPVGACRQCLVEVSTPGPDGTLRAMPKPQASCTLAVSQGMVIKTQKTSVVAEKAQHGVLELLLINHPLDCPVCDKGGECPLQNQALSNGQAESRFTDVKRTYAKPVPISSQVLLDRERCVLCARCTRFSEQIAGDPFIELLERGALQQVGIYADQPFESYFSGNTVQICPVGALTGAAYRFRSRPFDLKSTTSVCEHCAAGCSLRVDTRRGTVLRRLAGHDTEVNQEWNCDKGRWAFAYTHQDRLTQPMMRNRTTGELEPASWPDALTAAASGLAAAGVEVGVISGGRITLEDAYAYSKFARVALGSNNIDYRSRPHSAEEESFLAAQVAGAWAGARAVDYRQLVNAPTVLMVGFEPEEESPIVFLRLRAAVKAGQRVFSIAPWSSSGLTKLSGALIPSAPGTEPEILQAITDSSDALAEISKLIREPGAVILVGERLAEIPGALSGAASLAESTGAALAWIPRRAGERGAIEAGALPTMLPGGRLVNDPDSLQQVAKVWQTDSLPVTPGLAANSMIQAALSGELSALVLGGVSAADFAQPAQFIQALQQCFVVSLEQRLGEVAEYADVVLPVAAVAEKSGTFMTWEGRERPFGAAIESQLGSDYRVLHQLAEYLSVDLGAASLLEIRDQLALLTQEPPTPAQMKLISASDAPIVGPGQAVLASWAMLLDAGSLQVGEPWLAGTSRASVARLSAGTAADLGLAAHDLLEISSETGSITLPYVITEMVDRVVWLPTNQVDSSIRRQLGVAPGGIVSVNRATVNPALSISLENQGGAQ